MNALTRPQVVINNGKATTTSNAVADFFHKQHKDVHQDNQIWLWLPQIGAALGYKRPHKIQQVYSRHADEFTPCMSQTVNLTVSGLQREQRIFSLRGAHLIAMFSRTPVAKELQNLI